MPLGIDFTQILLHALNVIILFVGLYLILFKPVKDFMAKREQHYKDVDDSINEKLANAEQREAEYDEKLVAADAEISEKKKQAASDITAMREQMEADARASADKIIEDARQEAEQQKKSILDSARADITEMVEEATRKVVLTGNTSEAYDMFLDDAERSNG